MRKQIKEKYRMDTGIFLIFLLTFFAMTMTILSLSKENDHFKPIIIQETVTNDKK